MTTDLPHGQRVPVPQPQGLELAPFRGMRYAPGRVSDLASVTAPPYDLINAEEAEQLRSADEHNIVRLIRPRDDAARGPYRSARDTLRQWLAEGVLATDDAPALYVYEERSATALQRGLIGGVRLAEPETGVVLPHEDTSPAPIADRLQLMRMTHANLEPILLLYEGGGPASTLVDEVADAQPPLCCTTTEHGLHYRLWAVTGPAAHARVRDDLRGRSALIADGHHRYATYLRFQAEQHAAGLGHGPWDYGLAMLVDSASHPPQLGAVHRVLPALPPHEARERARTAFRVTAVPDAEDDGRDALAAAARRGPAFLLADDKHDYLLSDPDPGTLDRMLPSARSVRWRQLSTAVLHSLLIPYLWGVGDDDNAVLTVHNDAARARRTAKDTGGTAVLLQPLDVTDVLDVAAGGERVPRKSTSFGPKPRTGFVLRTLDDECLLDMSMQRSH